MTFLERDLDFSGRRILVTGGANGLGAAMARGFAKNGAHVLIADIEEENASRLAREIGNAEALRYDQSDPDSIRGLADRAGAVDVLVNNAGILLAKPLLECAWEEIRRLVDIDLLGVVLLTQLIGRGMVERRRGVIINISSQMAFCGGEGRVVYAAAKAAVAQLTRGAAVEWGSYGVRVVGIAPGRSATRMTESVRAEAVRGRAGIDRVPLGRWGTPEEIAKLAVFLASDAASYITGETVIADGGYVLG
ncbi:MAG: SDR family oxidoreductase [Rhodospirillales bacterium]|nr:SDR family oxidoreductase [Rhodospirillales bacterium]